MPDKETPVDELDEPDKSKKSRIARPSLLVFLVACVAFLLLALGLAAGYIVGQANSLQFTRVENGVTSSEVDAPVEDDADREPEEEEILADAIYYGLRPEFTVNFHDGQKERYLMVSMDVMARDQEIIDRVERDLPVVRYQILRVLGRQDSSLFEENGKDKLVTDILSTIQGIVDLPTGTVEAVYLTSFVVQ